MPRRRRLTRFVLVGGTGAVFNVSLLVLLIDILGWHHLLAAVVTIEVSTFLNYLLNRTWTWQDRKTDHWSFLHYHHATLVGMVIQWLAIALGTSLLGIHYAVAAFLGILAASGWNFLAHHYFTFAHAKPENRELRARVALYGLAALVLLAGSALFAHDWDTFVFQRSVEDLVRAGQTPYDVGAQQPDYIFFGVSTPIQSLWYAYPPLPLIAMTATYWPAATNLVAAPWLGRVLIKLPFVLSTLGFAYLARRLVAGAGGFDARERANRLERLLLFNPLFLIIAAVWGQFESLVLVFLLLSVLAMRQSRWGLGGAAWGLAAAVKIFPIYLGPLWLLYLVRRSGWKAAARFFLAGAAAVSAVCLPFFLDNPQGFLQQVFLMHSGRTPARFAPIAFVYNFLKYVSQRSVGALPDDAGIATALSLLSFILTAFVLGLLALASLRTPATERNLLLFSGLSLLGGLLVTKIISEQYMLLPIGLLLLYQFHGGAADGALGARRNLRLLTWTTWTFLAAAILDSAHFLVFIPDDIIRALFAATAPEMIASLAALFNVSAVEFRVFLGIVISVALVVPFVLGFRAIGPFLVRGLETTSDFLARRLSTRTPSASHLRATLAVILVLLVLPPLAMGAIAPRRQGPPADAGAVPDEGPLLIAHYRADWFNPTTRPEVLAGNWDTSQFTPVAGYYNSIAYKASQDFALLRLAKVDAILIPLNPAFESYAMAVHAVAEEERMPYGLEADLGLLDREHQGIPITASTADQARELLDGPSFGFWGGGYHLRLGRDEPPALFLRGAERLTPRFTEDERRFVAALLSEQELRPFLGTRSPSTAWQMLPSSVDQLEAGTPQAALWRTAYERALDAWWRSAFGFLAPDHPTPRLALYVDQAPARPLPADLPAQIQGHFEPPGTPPLPEAAVRHVAAQPLDASAFQASYVSVLRADPAALIVSWNDLDLGLGLEPTTQGGSGLLSWLAMKRGNTTLPLTRSSPAR